MKEDNQAIIHKIHDILSALDKSARQVAFLSFLLCVPYIIIYCCISSTEECIKTLSSSIPVLLLLSTIIIEIKESIRMWAATKWERLKRRRSQRRQKDIQSAIDIGMKIANEKHMEWEEWIKNGGDESNKPSSPELPEQIVIMTSDSEL